MSTVEIGVDVTFEAAHWLPNVAADHKCKHMHGHSYRATITVTGPIRDDGMLLDYADIKSCVAPLTKLLDHQVLNDIIANPTAENLAVWLWHQLDAELPLAAVTIHETAGTHCTYRGHR